MASPWEKLHNPGENSENGISLGNNLPLDGGMDNNDKWTWDQTGMFPFLSPIMGFLPFFFFCLEVPLLSPPLNSFFFSFFLRVGLRWNYYPSGCIPPLEANKGSRKNSAGGGRIGEVAICCPAAVEPAVCNGRELSKKESSPCYSRQMGQAKNWGFFQQSEFGWHVCMCVQ